MAQNGVLDDFGNPIFLGVAKSKAVPRSSICDGVSFSADGNRNTVCIREHARMGTAPSFGFGHGIVGEQWLGFDAHRKEAVVKLEVESTLYRKPYFPL